MPTIFLVTGYEGGTFGASEHRRNHTYHRFDREVQLRAVQWLWAQDDDSDGGPPSGHVVLTNAPYRLPPETAQATKALFAVPAISLLTSRDMSLHGGGNQYYPRGEGPIVQELWLWYFARTEDARERVTCIVTYEERGARRET